MKESMDVYDQEQRLVNLSRRLQQQNEYVFHQKCSGHPSLTIYSQLMALLADVNDSAFVPATMRNDLNLETPAISDLPALSPDHGTSEEGHSLGEAEAALREIKEERRTGQINEEEFAENSASLTTVIQRARSLRSLSKVPHSSASGPAALPLNTIPTDITEASPVGYLDPIHSDEYLATLAAFLGDPNVFDVEDPEPPFIPPAVHPTDKEKERSYQLHNSMSVYNWLNKHKQEHDDVFIDQTEDHFHTTTTKEKASKNSNGATSSSRRASSPKHPPQPTRVMKRDRTSTGAAAAAAQQEMLMEEMLDEDNTAAVTVVTPEITEVQKKRKRGQKDDDAYRPKGGSSRPTKRKRASTGNAVGGRGHEKSGSSAGLGEPMDED